MRDDPFSSGSFRGNILHTTLKVTERCADRRTCVYTLISTMDTPSEAQPVLAAVMSAGFDVENVRHAQERGTSQGLYDLTGLHTDMNRTMAMTTFAALQTMQSLCEAELVTYPRNDSRYITHDGSVVLRLLA